MIRPSKLKQLSTVYLSSIIQSQKKKGFEEEIKSFNIRQSFKVRSNQNQSQSIPSPTKDKQEVRLPEFDTKVTPKG